MERKAKQWINHSQGASQAEKVKGVTPWPQQPQLHVKSCAGVLDHRWEGSQPTPTPAATLPPSWKTHSHLHLQSHGKCKNSLQKAVVFRVQIVPKEVVW